jgi:intein/homing endonuclease
MGIREDSEYLRFSEVESIQLVGEEEVWDIEVEEDHSYVAHGMVHHNSCRGPNVQ